MERIALRETRAPYTVTLDEKMLHNEATLLEQNGALVAVVLPAASYEAFCAWQQREQSRYHPSQAAAFARERSAFEQMLPMLQKEHAGKVVVVYRSEVVEIGDEIGATLERVYARYGYVSCYAGRVEASPRVYKFPHRKVIR